MEQAGLPDTTAPRIKRKNLRNEKLDISSFMERAGIPSLADRIPAPLLCFKSYTAGAWNGPSRASAKLCALFQGVQ